MLAYRDLFLVKRHYHMDVECVRDVEGEDVGSQLVVLPPCNNKTPNPS